MEDKSSEREVTINLSKKVILFFIIGLVIGFGSVFFLQMTKSVSCRLEFSHNYIFKDVEEKQYYSSEFYTFFGNKVPSERLPITDNGYCYSTAYKMYIYRKAMFVDYIPALVISIVVSATLFLRRKYPKK